MKTAFYDEYHEFINFKKRGKMLNLCHLIKLKAIDHCEKTEFNEQNVDGKMRYPVAFNEVLKDLSDDLTPSYLDLSGYDSESDKSLDTQQKPD